MSSVTTLSPSFQGKPARRGSSPELVFGRKAISEADAPTNAGGLLAGRLDLAYQRRQSAAPRSRTFSMCAVIASATRRGRGATAAWLK